MDKSKKMKKLLKLLYVSCQQSLTEQTNEQIMTSKGKYHKLLTLREDLNTRIEFLRDQRSALRVEKIKLDIVTIINEMYQFGFIDKSYVKRLSDSIENDNDINKLTQKLTKLNRIHNERKQSI